MGVFDKIKAGLGVVLSRADSYPPSATDPVRPSGSDVGWGWANAMTGMGYGATDPTAHTAFTRAPVLTAAEAWGLYEGDGLASRVVSLPATEALRQGWDVTWEGDEGASERVARWAAGLRIGPEERGLQVALSRWLMWRSIFGGSVIVLVCADGRPTSAPLDEVAPNLRQLRVLSRWDVQPTTYTQDPVTGQSLSAGDVWSVGAGAAHYHRSRLIFLGRGATPYSVPDLRQGWSASTYERIYSRLAACGTVDGAAARIVTSFTSPVQRMRGLAEALAQGGDAIIKRMGFEQTVRSLYRVTLLDADNESYENQTVSVAGLPELMDRFPERVAAATGIPLTLLQGHAPAGLSTDDQSGRRFFLRLHQGHRAGAGATPGAGPHLDVGLRVGVWSHQRNTPARVEAGVPTALPAVGARAGGARGQARPARPDLHHGGRASRRRGATVALRGGLGRCDPHRCAAHPHPCSCVIAHGALCK